MRPFAWIGSVSPDLGSFSTVGRNLFRQFLRQGARPHLPWEHLWWDPYRLSPELVTYCCQLRDVPRPATVVTWGVNFMPYPEYERRLAYTVWDDRPVPPFFTTVAEESGYHALAVPSAHTRNLLREEGVTLPIALIPHGVCPEEWPEVDRRGRRYGVDRPFTFLHIGIGHVRKNQYALVEGFQAAFRADDPVRLVLKVWGEDLREVEDPRIRFVRESLTPEAVWGLYRDADAYVYPSRAEGFSLTTLEAMSTGLPVILPCHTALADQCDPRYNYPLWRNRPDPDHVGFWQVDLEELAARFREVYASPEESRERGRSAAAWTRLAWSWERAYRAFEAFLEDYGLEGPSGTDQATTGRGTSGLQTASTE